MDVALDGRLVRINIPFHLHIWTSAKPQTIFDKELTLLHTFVKQAKTLNKVQLVKLSPQERNQATFN